MVVPSALERRGEKSLDELSKRRCELGDRGHAGTTLRDPVQRQNGNHPEDQQDAKDSRSKWIGTAAVRQYTWALLGS